MSDPRYRVEIAKRATDELIARYTPFAEAATVKDMRAALAADPATKNLDPGMSDDMARARWAGSLQWYATELAYRTRQLQDLLEEYAAHAYQQGREDASAEYEADERD
jgi:hypothetical protein